PSLETFMLYVQWGDHMEQESLLGNSSHDLRQMPGHLHRNIKDVQIIGFCSAKSIVELTCHMLENAKSLGCLTLSTCFKGENSCSDGEYDICLPMSRDMIMEAHKALLVVERYILGKVPSTVELKVIEPCSRCNALEI
uniref:At1g61320/AtMIF1 LRR domain-containing protein n=2 Tax=Aegilops tauschii TaxID=37682 RepID=A0A453L6I8_AEGTS